jgi:anaerobic C4-dicarboxylate transporter
MSLQDITSVLTLVMSVLTFLVAAIALFSWHRQEQLKTKLAFKNAIADYLNQLKKTASHHQRPTLDQNQKSEELFNACYHALLVTEGLLDENKEVMDAWEVLANPVTQYLVDGGDRGSIQEITDACDKILNEKFVFNKCLLSLCKR